MQSVIFAVVVNFDTYNSVAIVASLMNYCSVLHTGFTETKLGKLRLAQIYNGKIGSRYTLDKPYKAIYFSKSHTTILSCGPHQRLCLSHMMRLNAANFKTKCAAVQTLTSPLDSKSMQQLPESISSITTFGNLCDI